MPDAGELVQTTDGKYGGGHTAWTCRACDETVYGPPRAMHCTALEGPAAVRISNLT
jgi:hypothetical protein